MLDDFFGAFDCPDAGQPQPKRNASITPLQSLNLLNGRLLPAAGRRPRPNATAPGGRRMIRRKQAARAFELLFQRVGQPPRKLADVQPA